MRAVTVLVIGERDETTLLRAALAKHPELRAVEVPNARSALDVLRAGSAPVALAIAGFAVVSTPARALLKALQARSIALVAIVAASSQEAKRRALAAGVKEIYHRPRDWPAYSALLDGVIQGLLQVN